MRNRWQTRIPGMILLGLLAAGCGGNSTGTTPDDETAAPAAETAAVREVTIDNFSFDPPELTVSPGTKVTWINRDDVPHTVTSTAKPKRFNSGTLDTDQRFSHVFTDPGTYEYFCAVHPKMTARVIVK
jgi:plastocyanin